MSRLVEFLKWGVHGDETLPDEEHKYQEGPELDCPAVACALGVFVEPEVEVESKLGQGGDVVGLGVRGGSCHGHNGVNDSQGVGFYPIDSGILDPVGFELPGEALFNIRVSL